MDYKMIFTEKAKIYHESRQRYPDEMIDFLYNKLHINSQMLIADIGSGTGILSECFLKRGNQVIGVEPNDAMRQLSNLNLSYYDNFKSIKATAENTKICENSVDIVISGQAFHWFRQNLFKKECLRICRKTPLIIIVWNKKADSLIEKERQSIRKSINNIQDYYQNSWDLRIKGVRHFFSEEYNCIEFNNDIINDYDTFIKRSLSDSQAPNKGHEQYNLYIDKLNNFFMKYSKNGVITIKNKTIVFWGTIHDI